MTLPPLSQALREALTEKFFDNTRDAHERAVRETSIVHGPSAVMAAGREALRDQIVAELLPLLEQREQQIRQGPCDFCCAVKGDRP